MRGRQLAVSLSVLTVAVLMWVAAIPGESAQNDLGRDSSLSDPTGVSIVAFDAEPRSTQVALRWQVLFSTLDVPAFHVWRALFGGEWVQLTVEPVQAQASAGQIADYAFTDTSVESGATYLYQLELESGGIFGPWQVVVPRGLVYLPMLLKAH